MGNDDNNKKGSNKIGGIESSKKTQEVKKAESITHVESIKATSGVGSVQGTGGIIANRKSTRIMSAQEREQLLRLVDDEADKLFKSGAIAGSNKELITKAVKMAVDSSIVLDTDVGADQSKNSDDGN
jgi:hypothetical protein